MKTTAIIGSQWGDEGKGKICHLLSRETDWVVRFNGGPNAGHTVVDEQGEFKFHLLPSGSTYSNCKVLLGNGMVVDPLGLKEELINLEDLRGVEPNIWISGNAHLIMPYHPIVENLEKSKDKVGTTGRGIGPTYQDKAKRNGFRFWDLLKSDFPEKFRKRMKELRNFWKDPDQLREIEIEKYIEEVRDFASKIENKVVHSAEIINRAIENGESVIFEGAQGSLLDLDFGTYPYVTSSNPTIGGVGTGAGVPPLKIEKVLGIVKAYTTRVGKGPLVTELKGEKGERLRDAGQEFGATTGRPRRCGWLDLLPVKYSAMINGFNQLALTKLDVLTEFDEIKVAVSYHLNGKKLEKFPGSLRELEKCEPDYVSLKGWDDKIENCSSYDELPSRAKDYVEFVEREVGVPVKIVSVGKEKKATIFRSKT